MIRSELPDNWQDLAADYILGDLSDEDAAQWERWLDEYPQLSDALETYQSAFNLFAEAVPRQEPPKPLLNKIRAQAQFRPSHKQAPLGEILPQAQTRPFRGNLWIGVGGAIAATLIATLGFQLYTANSRLKQANSRIQNLEQQLQQARSQTQTLSPVISTLQEPSSRIYSLQGSQLASAASGRLVMSSNQEVLIVVKNLPSLPEGRVYRLWAELPTQSTLTYCGQFNSNRQGIISLRPSTKCGQNPTQMLITIDAITHPTTKGGPVVMHGAI